MDLPTVVDLVTEGYNRYTLSVAGTEILIQSSASELAVVFRGSDSAGDWLVNLDAGRVPFFGVPGAEVHGGFFTAYCRARQDLLRAVENADPFRRKTVWAIGHSHGGSKAVLFAADLLLNKTYRADRVRGRTFGCPNTGNAEFNALLSQVDVDQYEHGYDPVPSVPPAIMGYQKLRFTIQGWSWWHTWLPVIRRLPSRIARDHLWKNYARVFGG